MARSVEKRKASIKLRKLRLKIQESAQEQNHSEKYHNISPKSHIPTGEPEGSQDFDDCQACRAIGPLKRKDFYDLASPGI
jgi:hypothetical protein